ncbi:RagB/SusD family nutrient uptake outer membrane protein [Dyadobacter flavalbus]|uniref:RagB/SusD family nutrient uptake outer membrane protein n=1 Tax=Dyadobacter flavalbus TaxID=2579942 RepID=A0A5M8QAM4_9BACT|nr:RagB/SusD family nutrient uptake outer membrane protein [Dyadobacter flavalbus]KAA6431602.1 RagB/SusD family nutrient uptake outer membrane protein [Dyadobacter flavalbus]
MKNKSTRYIVLASVLSVAALSCTDLNEEVYSEVLATNYQPTEKDLPAIVAPVYSSLRGLMLGWQGYFDLQEEAADAIITPVRPNGWDDGGTYRRMHQHTWTSLQWQPENAWQSAFRSITTANRVLSQIEDGEIPLTTGKEAIQAELRAVRAFAYYLLLDNHGNVPIVTDFKDVNLPKQSTRKELYDFVVKELTEVMPLLSENAATTYGQMNRWSAKTLLAKIYLNAEVYTGIPEWAKAIEQADEVIKSGKYALDANYSDVFTWTNFNSKEIIFAIPYDEIYGTGNQIHMKTLDPLSRSVYPMNAGPWGGNCAVPQFIDTYDAEDSRLAETWIMGPQRNAVTGAVVITYSKSVPGMEKTASSDGYRIGKYKIKPNATGSLDNDFPFLRYADVLMIKAEALLRTGKAEEAAALVTQVRARAFKNNPAKGKVNAADLAKGSKYNYGYQAADGSITERQGGDDIQYGRFMDELGWEFAAEAHRRQDLIRFKVYETKKWFNHRPQSAQRALFPIPQNEIDKNPNLKQNPGY